MNIFVEKCLLPSFVVQKALIILREVFRLNRPSTFFSLVSILNGWNGCLDWLEWIDFEGF